MFSLFVRKKENHSLIPDFGTRGRVFEGFAQWGFSSTSEPPVYASPCAIHTFHHRTAQIHHGVGGDALN